MGIQLKLVQINSGKCYKKILFPIDNKNNINEIISHLLQKYHLQ